MGTGFQSKALAMTVYAVLMLTTGFLLGAGFVLVLQWMLRRDRAAKMLEPLPSQLHELYMGHGYRDPKRIAMVKKQLKGFEKT